MTKTVRGFKNIFSISCQGKFLHRTGVSIILLNRIKYLFFKIEFILSQLEKFIYFFTSDICVDLCVNCIAK